MDLAKRVTSEQSLKCLPSAGYRSFRQCKKFRLLAKIESPRPHFISKKRFGSHATRQLEVLLTTRQLEVFLTTRQLEVFLTTRQLEVFLTSTSPNTSAYIPPLPEVTTITTTCFPFSSLAMTKESFTLQHLVNSWVCSSLSPFSSLEWCLS